ncbi:hypothetical protein [Paracoccus sp. ME4]|uniref:hypothetical protein n=1 Tax=Paracoccus sp. ME4 TaxID=3138066 RepID=UPI00398AC0CD
MSPAGRPIDAWIDELEADLGAAAALRLLANAGGQRRQIPASASGSKLAIEVGEDVVAWLSDRFGGMAVDIPNPAARDREAGANRLRAAILEAGLTQPKRSANVIAAEFGVTAAWVHKLRTRMRQELGSEDQLLLPLFDHEAH